MRIALVILMCALAMLLGARYVEAQNANGASAGPGNSVLGSELGTVSFPTACEQNAAKSIERGVAALHHMMYSSARDIFEAAAKRDPHCAMALWGVAMTYIHPLWSDRPSGAIIKKGGELAAKAAVIGGKSARETAYLDTIKAYFVDGVEVSEEERLKLFEAAWARATKVAPEDYEAKAFYALAHLSTAKPSDKSYATQNRAAELAKEVLDAVPSHPGGHHYTIHALDYPPLAKRALQVAYNYGKIAPNVSHALHMMSHIFTRRGLWRDSIEWNRQAATAALKLSKALGALSLHYPHALDYKGYAHLQKAQDGAALKVTRDLAALEAPFYSVNQNAMAYAFAAMPARYAVERQAWGEAAKLKLRRPKSFPWVDTQDQFVAMTHFARGLGLAHEKHFDDARAEIATLAAIHKRVSQTNAYWAKQVDIQRLSVEAWTAYLSGETDKGLATMEKAATLEATTEKSAVSPGEVVPAAELHGDMLLSEKRYAGAIAAYETALNRSPRRFNSLYGAARAHELSGDMNKARARYGELVDMCAGAPGERPRLTSARGFLKAN